MSIFPNAHAHCISVWPYTNKLVSRFATERCTHVNYCEFEYDVFLPVCMNTRIYFFICHTRDRIHSIKMSLSHSKNSNDFESFNRRKSIYTYQKCSNLARKDTRFLSSLLFVTLRCVSFLLWHVHVYHYTRILCSHHRSCSECVPIWIFIKILINLI